MLEPKKIEIGTDDPFDNPISHQHKIGNYNHQSVKNGFDKHRFESPKISSYQD